MSERVESLLEQLIEVLNRQSQALNQQTEAINHLANSNQQLIQTMIDMDDVDPDEAEPLTYLDGSFVE